MFLIQKKKKKKTGLSNKCAPGKFPRQFNGIMRNAIGFNLSGIETIIIIVVIISPPIGSSSNIIVAAYEGLMSEIKFRKKS